MLRRERGRGKAEHWSSMKMSEGRELIGNETIWPAGRHFPREAGLRMRLAPLGKYPRHDEPHRRQKQAAGGAFGGVGMIASREFRIELGGEHISGGSFNRVRAQLQPPFVAVNNLPGSDAVAQRGHVKIDRGPAIAFADREQTGGDFLFSDSFAKGIELALSAAGPLQARRIKR